MKLGNKSKKAGIIAALTLALGSSPGYATSGETVEPRWSVAGNVDEIELKEALRYLESVPAGLKEIINNVQGEIVFVSGKREGEKLLKGFRNGAFESNAAVPRGYALTYCSDNVDGSRNKGWLLRPTSYVSLSHRDGEEDAGMDLLRTYGYATRCVLDSVALTYADYAVDDQNFLFSFHAADGRLDFMSAYMYVYNSICVESSSSGLTCEEPPRLSPGGSHPNDFFADAFALYYHSGEERENLRKKHPRMHAFLAELEEHLPEFKANMEAMGYKFQDSRK